MIQEKPIFETNNVDLSTYLIMLGVQLLESVKSSSDSRVVIFRFIDEKRNCLDLERAYLSSDFKKFRDINKYLLSEVHKTLRK